MKAVVTNIIVESSMFLEASADNNVLIRNINIKSPTQEQTGWSEINLFELQQKYNSVLIVQHGIYKIKEGYMVEAIRNYIRKLNFSELMDSLNNNEITAEEFDKKLEAESDKYIVTLKELKTPFDITLIHDIVQSVGFDLHEFTTCEIAEMFSIKEENLLNSLIDFKLQLK